MIRMDFGPGLTRWSEAQFQSAVIEVAAYFGWTDHYHTHDSRGSQSGFPDLVIANQALGVVAFLELKTGRYKPTPDQVHWIEALQACGQHAYIVYPRDMDFIQDLLSGHVEAPARGESPPRFKVPDEVLFNQSPENTGRPRPKGRRRRPSM